MMEFGFRILDCWALDGLWRFGYVWFLKFGILDFRTLIFDDLWILDDIYIYILINWMFLDVAILHDYGFGWFWHVLAST